MVDRRSQYVLALALVMVSATSAFAQPAPAPGSLHDAASLQDGDRPWARGVPEEQQAIARSLHAAGNAEFVEGRYAQALVKYREALRHWDHPSIRFNMAVCLIHLDQLVEAKDNLDRSLAYNGTALDDAAHAQALAYRQTLDALLAHVAATSSEPGAAVAVDGKYWFSGPGTAELYLLPGQHQLAATKPGFRTTVVAFVGVAGKRVAFDLQQSPEPQARTSWPYWKHVLGGGALLVAVGVATYASARGDLADYNQGIAERCPHGCSSAMYSSFTDLQAMKESASTKRIIAFSVLSGGGVAALVGVLGLLLDRPPSGPEPYRAEPVLSNSRGATALSLRWRF